MATGRNSSQTMQDVRIERPASDERRERRDRQGVEQMVRRRSLRSRNHRRTRDGEGARTVSSAGREKKMTGVGFYMIVGVAVLKDIADVVTNASTIFSWLPFLVTPVVAFIVGFYLFYVGVRPDARKVATWSVSLLVDLLPFVSFLPTYSLSLFIIRWWENGGSFQKIMGKYTGGFTPRK